MTLYKNVDIKDLESILQKGILSLDESNNNNWDQNKRANNRTDVVYLFKPLTEINTFPKYGVALIKCEVEATQNQIDKYDVNNGKYEEYITCTVTPEQITNIYIPELFKERVELSEETINKITWCDMSAEHFIEDGFIEANREILEQFANTAELESDYYNFFRGVKNDRTMIDLYNVKYINI